MRITHSVLSDTAASTLMRNLERLQRVQEQITTGRKYTYPSDNPTAATQIVHFTGQIAESEQYRRTIDNGIAWNEATSSVLTHIENLLAEILDVSEQASNGAATSAERDHAATMLQSLLEELVMTANRKFTDKYVFGGTETLTAPFTAGYDAAGTLITGVTPNPMGTDGLWSYLVSKTDTLVMNTPGSEVFQPNGEGAADDVFEIVIRLRQALDDQDFDTMATEEGRLREATSRITGINAQVGSRINRLESISDDLENQILTYEDRRSQLQDTDLAEAIIEFNAADTAYQAALASTARILNLSLVDFI